MIVNLAKYIPIDLIQIREHIKIILDKEFDVLLISGEGILTFIPFSQINNVLLKDDIEPYIKKSSLYIDKALSSIVGAIEVIDLNKQHADIHDINVFYGVYKNCEFTTEKAKYNKHFNEIISMRHRERIEYLKNYHSKLKPFLNHTKLDLQSVKLVLDILTDIALIERLNLIYHLNYIKQNNISDLKNYQNVKKDDLLFADLIGDIIKILEKENDNQFIFNTLPSFYDDNVICHSNRVFLMMVELLNFYNEEISRGILSKLRVDYKKKYFSFYEQIRSKYNLLTKADRIEDISKTGLRKLDSKEIKSYARAAFWHDIALLDILPNFPIVANNESDSHAILGFNLLKYCMAQNEYTYSTVGLHHEYYGTGYGTFINLYNKQLANKQATNIEYILTYEPNDLETLSALSYFPAKMLEIVDTYDSLFISFSKDRSKGTVANEVIAYMYENFLEETVKLDPILFSVFVRYLEQVKNIMIFDCPL